jgi:hypothetical protein
MNLRRWTGPGLLACLLLVNGAARAGVTDDTRAWTKRDFTGGPVGRYWHYMTYAGGGKVLMIGGNLNAGTEMASWFWDGASGSWSSIPADLPPPAKGGAIALTYDSQRQRAIFFGGTVYGSTDYHDSNELWELDTVARQWKKLTPAGASPSARSNAAFGYDPVRKRAILQGGYAKGNSISDTWEWDGTRWTKLSPATMPSSWILGMVWMPDRQRLFAFCQGSMLQAWAWDGQNWSLDSEDSVPDMPSSPALAYAGSGRVVAFGGEIYDSNTMKQTAYGDTYEWSRGTWTKVATAQKPSIREASVAVYDESRDRAVLYGGRAFRNGDTNLPSDVRADLWEYAITRASAGTACESAHADRCATGNCVEGVCCGSARCGSCESCAVMGSEGRCAPLDPLPSACVLPPDAGPTETPDGAAPPPPAPDGAAPVLADGGGADPSRDGGTSGTAGPDGGARPPGRTDGAAPEGDALGGGGSPDEETDGGRGKPVKVPGAQLYSGPACSFVPGGGGSMTSLALLFVAALIARRRRR